VLLMGQLLGGRVWESGLSLDDSKCARVWI
jgi:hypothetical protein